MKKIAFALKGMYLGGTEKALLTALDHFPFDNFDVTIILLDKKGVLLDSIPNNCHIKYIEKIEMNYRDSLIRNGFKENFKYYIKKMRFFKAFKILFRRIVMKDLLAEIDGYFDKIPMFENEFDIVISFQYHDTFMTRYVAEKVRAKKKYVWVHNDLSTTKYYYEYTYNYIGNYDAIYSVSKTIENELKKAYGQYKERIHTKYNYFDTDKIITMSNEDIRIPWDNNVFSILSVGRLNYQKGFDIAVNVATKLRDANVNYVWYIIGDGEEKDRISALIRKNKLDNNVFLFGAVSNPFPYMKNCKLYVQPSRHEGYCTTTKEALLLSCAVISTDVSGAREQIEDEVNGFIVEINPDAIFKKIIKIYNNNNILDNIKKHNQQVDYNNNYFDFLLL